MGENSRWKTFNWFGKPFAPRQNDREQMDRGNLMSRTIVGGILCALFGAVSIGPALAGETEDLAKAAQNPVASLISLPFQNNTNFDVGPLEKTQNIMNIQPVWPFEMNEDWNLITRTIIPVISQPASTPAQDREFGLGDTVFTAFLSPKDSGEWIWGVGPVLLLPTSTDYRLGAGEWGAGPSAVVLTIRGPWVVGSLFSRLPATSR